MQPALSLLVVAAAALPGSSAIAQNPPDAGILRQQIEQGRAPRLPVTGQSGPVATGAATKADEASGAVQVKAQVRAFRIQGNTLLDDASLQAVLQGYQDRLLDYPALQAAAASVATRYREAGWVVRTLLPEQDIVDGVVTIQVVEAVLGRLMVQGEVPPRANMTLIQNILDAALSPGQPLNARALDRALLLADDLSGAAVSGSLREGGLERQTDLLLRLQARPLLSGDASLDNQGSRSTGEERLSASLTFNSPAALGDLWSTALIHSEGSDYLRASANLPLGSRGWRLSANATSLQYRIITPEFAALGGRGSSDSMGLEASYPLLRTRLCNLYLGLNADHKHYDNQANAATTSNYSNDSFGIALWGNGFDNVGRGGSNYANLSFSRGQLSLAGSPNQANDALGPHTEGGYDKLRYVLSRLQLLGEDLSLYAALSGQWSDRNLDASEKFYLGGANGVRAYPASEAGGSTGQLLNLELRWRLPEGFTLGAFYDTGTVSANQDNHYAGAPAANEATLQGAGLSVGWLGGRGINLKASWAQRIGSNPLASRASGRDQDGSYVTDRLWLSAGLVF